jgi:hypothetical protein
VRTNAWDSRDQLLRAFTRRISRGHTHLLALTHEHSRCRRGADRQPHAEVTRFRLVLFKAAPSGIRRGETV